MKSKLPLRSLGCWLLAGLGAVLVLPVLFLAVYPRADAAICYARVGTALGTEPDLVAIIDELRRELAVGLSRTEVHETLSAAGYVETSGVQPSQSARYASWEKIFVRMCRVNSNNLEVIVDYDVDDRLVEASFWNLEY